MGDSLHCSDLPSISLVVVVTGRRQIVGGRNMTTPRVRFICGSIFGPQKNIESLLGHCCTMHSSPMPLGAAIHIAGRHELSRVGWCPAEPLRTLWPCDVFPEKATVQEERKYPRGEPGQRPNGINFAANHLIIFALKIAPNHNGARIRIPFVFNSPKKQDDSISTSKLYVPSRPLQRDVSISLLFRTSIMD